MTNTTLMYNFIMRQWFYLKLITKPKPMVADTVTLVSVVTAPMVDMAATVASAATATAASVDMVIMEQHLISTEM